MIFGTSNPDDILHDHLPLRVSHGTGAAFYKYG